MELTDKDKTQLPFYPSVASDYLEKYPQLKKVQEFVKYKGNYPFTKIFTYVILYYSKNTPLMQIADHNDRKRVAAEMSDFSLKTDKYIDAIMARDKEVNKVIMAYLRMQKSFAWSKLCGFIDSFYHQLARLQAGETDQEKTKDLLSNISKTEEEIEKTLAVFLNGDPNPSIRDVVLTRVEEDRVLSLRPEEQAE